MKSAEKTEKDSKNPMTPIELAKKFADAWEKHDVSVVSDFLSEDIHMSSSQGSGEISSKSEFLNYLERNFHNLTHDGIELYCTVGTDDATGYVGVRVGQDRNDDVPAFYRLSCDEDLITYVRLMLVPTTFKASADAAGIFDAHGDHIEGIMEAEKYATDYIPKIIQDAKHFREATCNADVDEFEDEPALVTAYAYGNGDLKMQFLTVSDENHSRNLFATSFPLMKGYPIEAEIDEVYEWSDQIEATVKCIVGNRDFSFFATDYYCNKDKYIAGGKINICLAVLGVNVKEGMRGFDFEGQQAVDFLAKTGEKPDYDENGNVKPIHFHMENMVGYFPTRDSSPDMGEFQSPVTNITHCSLFDIDFVKCDMEFGISDYEDRISVPLYFRQEFLPDIKEETPVQGILWMVGYVDEPENNVFFEIHDNQ